MAVRNETRNITWAIRRRWYRLGTALRALCAASAMLPVVWSGESRAADSAAYWPDIESRIQYGYFTEDRRALGRLGDTLAADDSPDKLKSYYAGLLAYRLTLLSLESEDKASPGQRAAAKEAAERCVAHLDRALRVERNFAEALALQGACLSILADINAWRAPLAGARSSGHIERALQLAPRNPRVLLLAAAAHYPRPIDPTQRLRLQGELRTAIAAFEAERQEVEHVPSWGAPEAYVSLARSYLEQGDAVAAREALEHALLLAPDFALARRMMKRILS